MRTYTNPAGMPPPVAVTEWQNILPNIPVEIPKVINSEGRDQIATFERITPRGLQYLNLSKMKKHRIPEDVLENYCHFGRPTPLVRARRLEDYLDTPARIYFKREDVIPTGSFKLNTALAQASRAKEEGYEGVVTETGAGQWALAISAACAIYRLKCKIFMARCSYEQKSLRRQWMEFYGSQVVPSPSLETHNGRQLNADRNYHHGSIGTAIAEATEFAMDHPGYAYLAGSNLPFVYIHQSVMGLEAIRQLRQLDETPDVVLACVGGGSNFAGFALPFTYSEERFETAIRIIGCESAVIPRLTKGEYRYDHSDPLGVTPLVKSYTMGKTFTPPPTHIGGLRQHNGSPVIGALLKNGLISAKAYTEDEVFDAGRLLGRLEGIMAAPESCHGIAGVIGEALLAKEQGSPAVIVSCISGSGILDLAGFTAQAEKAKTGRPLSINF